MFSGQNLDFTLYIAVILKQYEKIERCLSNGAKLTYRDSNNEDAFHQAVLQNDPKVLKLLLDAKFEPDCLMNRPLKMSPVAYAAYLGYWDCVKLFAQHRKEGGDNKYQFDFALWLAVKANRLEEAELLIKAGAHLGWATNQDFVLHVAVANNNAAMANLLLQHKADLTVKNKEGLTPVDLAKKMGRLDLFQTNDDKLYLANVDSFLKSYDPTTLKSFFTTFPSNDSLDFFNSIKAIYESNAPAQERKEKIGEKIKAHIVLKANKKVSRSIDKLKKFNLYDTAKEVIVSSSWNIKKV